MATKKSETQLDQETFIRKMTKLDREYRQILDHIKMLESMKKEKEAEIQAFMDKMAGLSS